MGEMSEALRRFKDRRSGEQPDTEPPVDSSPSRRVGMNGNSATPPTQLNQPTQLARTSVSNAASLLAPGVAPAPASSPAEAALNVQQISDHDDYRVERMSMLDPNSPAAASARQLAQRVKRQAAHRRMRTLVVTSPLSGDGKTTVSCNLAMALTGLDRSRSVALVDLDLRRPSVAERLGLRVKCGIDDVLDGKNPIEEALLGTNVPGLTVVAVREARAAPEPMLASEVLKEQIQRLQERFSMVIIDTPPILLVSDALSVIDEADGALLVVRAGRSSTASVRGAVDHLPVEKMLGCCLNYASLRTSADKYESYYPVSKVGGTPPESSDSNGSES